VIVTSISATLFFAVGGALGSQNWRTPFWLYASSLLLAVLVGRFIWNPLPQNAHHRDGVKPALPPLDWRPLVLPCAVTFVGGISFYLLIVELSYKLDDIGITSTATIGAASALASVATSAGSFAFGRSTGRSVRTLLTTAFVLLGVGQLVVAAAQAVPLVLLGAIVAGAGGGLLLPTMLTWTLAGLSYAQRGRGTGLWTASIFLGEFVCPVIVVALGAAIAGLASAIAVVGVVSLLMAALVGTRMLSSTSAPGSMRQAEPQPSVAA
jgi:predicted MFS family arabinose efflux permease